MDLHGWPHGVDAWNMEGVIKRQEHCRHAAGHVALFPQACAFRLSVQAICKLYVPGGKITTTTAWNFINIIEQRQGQMQRVEADPRLQAFASVRDGVNGLAAASNVVASLARSLARCSAKMTTSCVLYWA